LALANAGRMRVVTALALSLLAAFGADALAREPDPAREQRWRRAAAAVALGGVVLAFAGTLVLPRLRDRIATAARAAAERKYAALSHPAAPLARYQAEAT